MKKIDTCKLNLKLQISNFLAYNFRREKHKEKGLDIQNKLVTVKALAESTEAEKNHTTTLLQCEKHRSSCLSRKLEKLREDLKASLESETRQTVLLTTFEKRKDEVEQSHRTVKASLISKGKENDIKYRTILKDLNESIKSSANLIKLNNNENHEIQKYKNKYLFQLDILRKEVESVQSTFDGKRAILDEIESKLHVLDRHVASRKDRFSRETNLLKQDQAELDSSSAQIAKSKEQIDLLTNAIADKSAILQTVKNEVNMTSVDVSSHEATLDEVEKEIGVVKREIFKSEVRMEKLTGSISARKSHSEFLDEQIHSMGGELTEANELYSQLLADESTIKDKQLQTTESIKVVTERNNSLSDDLASLIRKKLELKQSYELEITLRANAVKLSEELSVEIETLSNTKRTVTNEIKIMTIRHKRLDVAVKREKSRMKSVQGMIVTTTSKLENINLQSQAGDIGTATTEEGKVQEEIELVNCEIAVLKTQLDEERRDGDKFIKNRYVS